MSMCFILGPLLWCKCSPKLGNFLFKFSQTYLEVFLNQKLKTKIDTGMVLNYIHGSESVTRQASG